MRFMQALQAGLRPQPRSSSRYSPRMSAVRGLGQSAFAMSPDMMVGMAIGAVGYVLYRKKIKKDL